MTQPAALDPAQHLPDLTADAAIRGLGADVELFREPSGIPHIRARTVIDAFAALGFAHAQDRLWQMEALFRRGTGRYAEWLGKRALAGESKAADELGSQVLRLDHGIDDQLRTQPENVDVLLVALAKLLRALGDALGA